MSGSSFTPLNIAVLTVSDTRDRDTDNSGNYLAEALQAEGHRLAAQEIVKDNIYQIRARLSQWIADPEVHAVLLSGGTGFSGRDSTPEAVQPLLDKEVQGFGELFRHLSYLDIGNSTIQSRALAGLANQTVIFCLPGSTGACRLGWNEIIRQQLDSRHKPCNFATLVTSGDARRHD